jgi:hypothetical protein
MKRAGLLLWVIACGEAAEAPTPSLRDRATATLPTAAVLHASVIRRSCSPNRGVCHNSSSYPDLSTPAGLMATLGAACNVEIPDPTLGWDACEQRADRLLAGDYLSELSSASRIAHGVWRFGVRVPPTITATIAARFEHHDGTTALDFDRLQDPGSVWAVAALVAGSGEVEVSLDALIFADDVRIELDPLLAAIVPGDPNLNGVFGAEAGPSGAVIVPGDPEASYLWRRINATVPGTRMPLANQALSEEEYEAIRCWIATGAGETIDYDRCE